MIRAANLKITQDQLSKIRTLDDFDLIMLISEVHDSGWPVAADTLTYMPAGNGGKPRGDTENGGGEL